MITTPTVLVLGAGSNQAYGFPSGSGLIEEVVAAAVSFPWQGDEFLANFNNRLRSSEVNSIDSWLEYPSNYNSFSRLALPAICLAIARKEAVSFPTGGLYQTLWNCIRTVTLEDLKLNKLSIVTFNYDRSLEEYFYRAACNFWKDRQPEEIGDYIRRCIPIFHVYGQAGYLSWQNPLAGEPIRDYSLEANFHSATECAKAIKLIQQGRDDADSLKQARKFLSKAEAIYIMGFGYNSVNCSRLEPGAWTAKEVRGTWMSSASPAHVPEWITVQFPNGIQVFNVDVDVFAREYATALHMPLPQPPRPFAAVGGMENSKAGKPDWDG